MKDRNCIGERQKFYTVVGKLDVKEQKVDIKVRNNYAKEHKVNTKEQKVT